jgi:PAS domain S-box-containing protein
VPGNIITDSRQKTILPISLFQFPPLFADRFPMEMKGRKRKFEYEVHLGLLVIVLILLCLNFVSNLIIYRAGESQRDAAIAELNMAALAVSRAVQGSIPPRLTEAQKAEFLHQYRLSSVIVIPSQPPDTTIEARRQWFQLFVRNLPPGQVPDIARKLLTAEYQTLTRGKHNEFFYVYPAPAARQKMLIILSKNIPELAYLDDSGRVVLIAGIIAIVAIGGLYLLLSRFIFAPFRKIRKEALQAGRQVDQSKDDVEALVEDYRRIIEELKEKEAQLLELNKAIQQRADSLEQFNQYLLTSINSGIVTVHKDGRILSINRAGAEIFGIVPGEYEGKPFTELFASSRELAQAVREALSEARNSDYREIDLSCPDGKTQTLGVSVSVIYDFSQRPIGASVLINDLTELKRLRRELETKNRLAALGEMAGGLAHQLRNSMGALSGYCNLLKRRLKKKGLESESLDSLAQEVAETEQLVDRFLQFARPLNLELQEVSITELITQVVDNLQSRPDYRLASLVLHPGDDVSVAVDALLLKQALTNILENAVNAYENKDGRVEIRVRRDAGQVHIQIEDFGCGIAEQDLDKIFTPFFSSRPSGTGLGLPLARKIIDLHGGTLAVTSQVGKGTVFTITLPVKSQSHDTPADSKSSVVVRT